MSTLYQITFSEAQLLSNSVKEKIILNQALLLASSPDNYTARIDISDISAPIPISSPTIFPLQTTITLSTTEQITTVNTTTPLLSSSYSKNILK